MKFNKAIKNIFIVLFSTLLISACSTAKKAAVDTTDDVYTGTETVKYLAKGVPVSYTHLTLPTIYSV